MFDLFRKSEKTKKYFMGGILVFVSASMLLYLVPNYNNGSSSSDVVVAKVGGEEITEAEARKMIESKPRANRFPPKSSPTTCPRSSTR